MSSPKESGNQQTVSEASPNTTVTATAEIGGLNDADVLNSEAAISTAVTEGIEGLKLGGIDEVKLVASQEINNDDKGALSLAPTQTEPLLDLDGTEKLEELLNHKLQTISTYMNLVSNKTSHALLLQENTVSGFLVLSLGDEDPVVVEKSFEVFHALSKFPENLPTLQKVAYFMDALRCVAKNSSVKEETRVNAKKLIAEMKSYKPNKPQQRLAELTKSSKNALAANTSIENNATSTTTFVDGKDAPPQNLKPTDLNATMSTMKRKNKGRETILFIENNILQQKLERSKVTQALIGVKGIISVTYDLKKNHCIVRGKRTVAPEDFGRAVASLGLANVHLVRKNENKEEILVAVPTSDKENAQFQYPPYPEDFDVENPADSSTAVERTDKPREGSSLLKSAKNFIARSFYW